MFSGKEFFIARRLYYNKGDGKNVSPPAITIATVSIAIGLVVMILAVAIVIGFKKEVRNKMIGFGSHIQISNFDTNYSYESQPIAASDSLLQFLSEKPEITHVQKFATKPGMIKTDKDFLGIILKGVDTEYDWTFFKENLIEGEILRISSDSTTTNVIISKNISDKLGLKLNDSFLTYFIQENVRARKFTITGIYQTNFSDYDKLFVLADIKQVRRLNQWDNDLVSGLEILVTDYDKLDDFAFNLYFEMQEKQDRLGNSFYVRSIKQLNPMAFAWLDVLDTNVIVILALMILVAGFSMISGLLIIILERANMIGILKALGENNTSIRKIFLHISLFLIIKGLFWGNVVGLSICFIQNKWGIIKLNPEIYYLSEVPIDLHFSSVLWINLGTLIAVISMLIGPSYLIARISPAKTIRFE